MKYIVLFLIPLFTGYAGTIIQLRDFLCGCEYCETVSTSEPLDIGRHMIMCHGWRDATLNTMRVMEEMRQAKIEQEKPKVDVPIPEENTGPQVDPVTGVTYDWHDSSELGPVFSDVEHLQFDVDQWLYLEGIEWAWMMANQTHYLFSYDHGWLYLYKHMGYRLYYWYDRRMWVFSRELHK